MHKATVGFVFCAIGAFAVSADEAFIARKYRRHDFDGEQVAVFPLLRGYTTITDSLTLLKCFPAESSSCVSLVRRIWEGCTPAYVRDQAINLGNMPGQGEIDSLRPGDTVVVTERVRDLEPSYHVFIPSLRYVRSLGAQARFVLVVNRFKIQGLATDDGSIDAVVLVTPLGIPVALPTPRNRPHRPPSAAHAISVQYVMWDLVDDCLVAYGEIDEQTRTTRRLDAEMILRLFSDAQYALWGELPFP